MKIFLTFLAVLTLAKSQAPGGGTPKGFEKCDQAKLATCMSGKPTVTGQEDTAEMTAKMCEIQQGAMDCAIEQDCVSAEDQQTCEDNLAEAKKTCPNTRCSAAGCFPATAIVELENGKTKSMNELVIGDKVRVGPKEYSEVFLFTTKMSETTSRFTRIVTDHTVLLLTHFHYLYANGELMQAHRVKVGDVIVLANGTKAPVNEVSSEWAPGLYNPHTLHGDIIVDGIKTSTYTSAVHPTLAHALLKPVAALYKAGVNFGEGFSAAIKSHLPSWVASIIKAA